MDSEPVPLVNEPSTDIENHGQVPPTTQTPNQLPQDQPQIDTSEILNLFPRLWKKSTEDNNLSLYGFRRFKTTHLLNLRYLEEEIDKLTYVIYQAGLKLDLELSPVDRLGLSHSKRDENALAAEEVLSREFILNLRSLIKEYDGALADFNRIMTMETFSLLDDSHQANQITNLTLYEKLQTRLIRVDLEGRQSQDPFQRGIHKYLRRFRYWIISRRLKHDEETTEATSAPSRRARKATYQNSVLLAEIFARFIVALATAIFLVVPLAVLSYQQKKQTQLITISVCIVVFSFVVSTLMKTANVHTLAVAAAYAAVLSVFVSSGPGT